MWVIYVLETINTSKNLKGYKNNLFKTPYNMLILIFSRHDDIYEGVVTAIWKREVGREIIATLQPTPTRAMLFKASCFGRWVDVLIDVRM